MQVGEGIRCFTSNGLQCHPLYKYWERIQMKDGLDGAKPREGEVYALISDPMQIQDGT